MIMEKPTFEFSGKLSTATAPNTGKALNEA